MKIAQAQDNLLQSYRTIIPSSRIPDTGGRERFRKAKDIQHWEEILQIDVENRATLEKLMVMGEGEFYCLYEKVQSAYSLLKQEKTDRDYLD